MSIKYKIDLPIDSPERTILHGEFIRSKKFLRRLYLQWYCELQKELPKLPQGIVLELGSGGGFLKEVEPSVTTSDIIDLPTNDLTFSALNMPFGDHTISCIFMTDTMHHIPDAHQFFKEVDRVLIPGGKLVAIEPANSLWGRFIYKNFHHEPFDPLGTWIIPSTGPMSGANGALPWILFERDIERFNQEFPNLKIETINYQNPLLYLISGGVSFRQLAPDFAYGPVNFIDHLLPKIWKQFSMFMLVKLKRME